MSVYVGIDVHRKRSQVAAVDESGIEACGHIPPAEPETAHDRRNAGLAQAS